MPSWRRAIDSGDGVEEAGAEPVGVEEHQRSAPGRATPVEDRDLQAIVLDVESPGGWGVSPRKRGVSR